jgi:hypothetical protein
MKRRRAFLRYETHIAWACLPSPQIRDAHCVGASPFFIRNWTIARFSIVSIKNWTQDFINCKHFRNRIKRWNGHIFIHWTYFTQISNNSHIFTQMVIFLNIEHISHKYPIKVKFLHRWSYFHTLIIFHTNIHWKSKFHTNGYIFTYWAYFTQSFCYFSLRSWFFKILDFFVVVVAQVRSFVGRWYYWLDHRGGQRRNLIKLIKLFLIGDILDSDDSSFSKYNHLKSFVYCVWNIEHLSNVFC